MAEEDRIVCTHCEKAIRYERPLFCPYCGHKLDPLDGLDIEDGQVQIYRWSRITPTLVTLFSVWLLALIPISLLFGRKAFVALSVIFSVLVIAIVVVNFVIHRRTGDSTERE